MKIRAVRVREVGIFRDAVAVEGFSGGLDVLAGPNELGKSTLLRALERLFFLQPASKAREIEQLRPHGGGAPLIEADFEVNGKHWRLRKQFLTGRGSAELTDLGTGRIVERGPDAHTRALALIGLSDDKGRGPLGLLWVAQDNGPKPLLLGADERSLMLAAIGSEVADVAAGQTLRMMQAQIKEELDAFLTEKTRKPKGAYDAALKAQARLAAELSAAEAESQQAASRQTELERLCAQQTKLTAPAHLATLAHAATAARRAIEEGRQAREKMMLAQAARGEQESKRQRIAAAVTSLRARLAERDNLGAQLRTLGPQITAAEAAGAAMAAMVEAAAKRRHAAETELSAAQASLRQRERLDVLVQLRARHADAREQHAEHARLVTAVGAIAATEALLHKAETEQRAIDALRAELNAAAPRVAIAYAPGVSGTISADGAPLFADTELLPTAPLLLEIAGVGRITITPVSGGDLAETRADLQAHREELEATLAAMLVADLENARTALARRRDLGTRLAVVTSKLAASAPDGFAALDQRLAVAERAVASDPSAADVLPDKSDIIATFAGLEQAHRSALHAAELAAMEAAGLAQSLTRLHATADAARSRLALLDADAAHTSDPAAQLAALETELAATTAGANAAVREAAAWAETAPGDDAWRAVQIAATQAQEAQMRAGTEITHLEQAIARIEGELTRGGEGDLAERIDELTGELAGARTKIARFETEAAALVLLQRLFEETQSSAQATFLQPVLARIEPYLRQVLPDTRLQLTENFSPAALARGTSPEATATLSGGTQEQLAVLTRLGFGRLLADRGQAAPVILDDALVYADDTRIERLFAVLRQAASHHQVIVLTCRSRLFAELGGTNLALTPWAGV